MGHDECVFMCLSAVWNVFSGSDPFIVNVNGSRLHYSFRHRHPCQLPAWREGE